MSNRYDLKNVIKKSYTDPRSSASLIARDCVVQGYSIGWSGDTETKEAIEKILAPFNIVYTDDMWGEWEVRAKS